MRDRTGIDIREENPPLWPYSKDYYDKKYGPRGWSNAETLNLAIGQGANSQTVANMARFYAALATAGQSARPEIAHLVPQRRQLYTLSQAQDSVLLEGLKAVLE